MQGNAKSMVLSMIACIAGCLVILALIPRQGATKLPTVQASQIAREVSSTKHWDVAVADGLGSPWRAVNVAIVPGDKDHAERWRAGYQGDGEDYVSIQQRKDGGAAWIKDVASGSDAGSVDLGGVSWRKVEMQSGQKGLVRSQPLAGLDTVVIGEGEKDEAPMLFNGEQVGDGTGPDVDVAVDPIDGTTLTAKGMPNAVSVLAVSERGSMYDPSAVFYMDKLVTGTEAADVVDIRLPVAENIRRIAKAKNTTNNGVTVVLLDRPRHEPLAQEIRDAGARIKFISDGDVAGAIMAARPNTGVDLLLGIGGTPEGIITACAIKCIGGVIQGRLAPKDDEEKQRALDACHDVNRVLTTNDLVRGDNCFFVATGITDGELLKGVRYRENGCTTSSLVMRSKSGTVRTIEADHRLSKVAEYASEQYQ